MNWQTPNRKRRRTNHRKVRTGCNTCRIRRVKCDETKPSCSRCLSFQGHCDGYVRPQREPCLPAMSFRTLMPNFKGQSSSWPFPREPTKRLFANETENRFFGLFVKKTASQLSGFFDSEIWSRLVLQACQSETSIRHAVIAIGALDMTTTALLAVQPVERCSASENTGAAAMDHHRFALQQYSKAISFMREAVTRGDQPLQTTLLACMLIVCFETYHGDYKAALSQIQIGLALMEDWFQSTSRGRNVTKCQTPEWIEDEICEAFVRLDIQVMTSVDSRDLSIHEDMMGCHSDAVDAMPPSFSSVREARFYAEVIMRRLMHFRIFNAKYHGDVITRAVDMPIETTPEPPENLYTELEKHIFELQRWQTSFRPLMRRIQKSGNEREYLCAMTLELHNLSNHCFFSTILGKDQVRYDHFLPQYKLIVDKSRILLTALGNISFMFDFQSIMPLYIVVRRCRHPAVRREAISLLLTRSWREGVWDSILAGKIGEWIMQIEEEGIDGTGFIPEWSRVSDAEINFDLKERMARVRCLRRCGEETEEVALRELEMTW